MPDREYVKYKHYLKDLVHVDDYFIKLIMKVCL
jgi:hypothetical protein